MNANQIPPLRKAVGPSILRLLDYFNTVYAVALVFDLMDCDLQSHLSKLPHRQLPLVDVYAVAVQLMTALSFLRNKGILHRDVHMKNLLVRKGSKSKPDNSSLEIYLTDFGWGTFSASEDSKSPVPLTGGAYTPTYRPPELYLALGARFNSKGEWTSPAHVPYGCAFHIDKSL